MSWLAIMLGWIAFNVLFVLLRTIKAMRRTRGDRR